MRCAAANPRSLRGRHRCYLLRSLIGSSRVSGMSSTACRRARRGAFTTCTTTRHQGDAATRQRGDAAARGVSKERRNESMNEQTNGQIGGWVEGWMGGWVEGWRVGGVDALTVSGAGSDHDLKLADTGPTTNNSAVISLFSSTTTPTIPHSLSPSLPPSSLRLRLISSPLLSFLLLSFPPPPTLWWTCFCPAPRRQGFLFHAVLTRFF